MTGAPSPHPYLQLVQRDPPPRRRYETRIVVLSARTPIGRSRTFRLTERDVENLDGRSHANGGGSMSLEKIDAEEFSQTLEQIGEGWFRQLALEIKLGVPEALGLTRRQWSDRIGVTVRGAAERRGAVTELSAEGLSNRAIADVLGVDKRTIARDLNGANAPPGDVEQEGGEGDAGANAPYPGAYSLINLESPAVKELPEHDKRALDAAVYELCCVIAFLEWFGEQPHDDEVGSWGALFEISRRHRLAAVTFCRLFPGRARLTDALKLAGAFCVGTARELRAAKRLVRGRAP